jgi:hypothetical protein
MMHRASTPPAPLAICTCSTKRYINVRYFHELTTLMYPFVIPAWYAFQMEADASFTVAATATITDIPSRRLRKLLSAVPLSCAGNRHPGEWRRLTPRDVFSVALLDEAMLRGMSRRCAVPAVAAIVQRLFGHLNPPISAILPMCLGKSVSVMAQDGAGMATIELPEIAERIAARAASPQRIPSLCS